MDVGQGAGRREEIASVDEIGKISDLSRHGQVFAFRDDACPNAFRSSYRRFDLEGVKILSRYGNTHYGDREID